MKSTKSLTFTSSKCLLNQINLKLKPNEFEWIGIACEELLRRCMAPFWVGGMYVSIIIPNQESNQNYKKKRVFTHFFLVYLFSICLFP